MGGLNGKIRTVGNLSGGGSIDRESIHPTSGNITPVVSYESGSGGIVSEEMKKASMSAFFGKMNDTNTRYKIVQDKKNKYRFFLYSLDIGEKEWRLQDEVTIPQTIIATGNTNGTISANGRDVYVKGLKQTAFTDIGYFADKNSLTSLEREVSEIKKSVVWENIADE